MNRLTIALLTAFLILASFPAHAFSRADDGDDMMSYDAIIHDLSRESAAPPPATSRARVVQTSPDPLETVLFHAGVGLASVFETLQIGNRPEFSLNQKGVQAAFGIDLFSENWLAEGTARSFGETDSDQLRASLQEFELKILYRERISRHMGIRAGAGLSARYLNLRDPSQPNSNLTYTTPTSLATLAMDLYLTNRVSFGIDLNARHSVIAETVDHNSFDATLRIDTHF